MTDIDILRRHREALGSQMASDEVYARGLRDEDEKAHWKRVVDALAWALAKLDEEIARAEREALPIKDSSRMCPWCGAPWGSVECQRSHP